MKVAIIIPCYNEEESIALVISDLKEKIKESAFNFVPIIINDCSKDNTLHIIHTLDCVYIDLPVNLGIGGAVQTGFKYALENRFDIAIQFDGDGQHPAEQLNELIKPIIENKADVVIGSRFIDYAGYQSTSLRRLGINYLSFVVKLFTKKKITDPTSGFRAINKKTLELVNICYPDEYPEPEALIYYHMSGLRINEVPVIMKVRMGGKSSIGRSGSVYYMVKVTLAMFFNLMRLKFNGKN